MSKFILREGFEVENQQVFFTIVLLDDADREIHSERLSVPLNATAQAATTIIETAVSKFPTMKIEDVIRDIIKGLTL